VLPTGQISTTTTTTITSIPIYSPHRLAVGTGGKTGVGQESVGEWETSTVFGRVPVLTTVVT